MSARAAWRLEGLGFREVYRYQGGIADWAAAALPTVRKPGSPPRVTEVLHPGVLTCTPGERVAEVRRRLEEAGRESCIVVNARRVVLGRARLSGLQGEPATPVEEVMEPGPTSTRPYEFVDTLTERLLRQDLKSILITTSDGVLLGVFRREDGERLLRELPAGASQPS